MKKQKSLALVPASARMPPASKVKIANDVPLSIRQAIQAFETQIGGRRALLEALSTADTSEDVRVVLDAIADPKYDTEPLAKLCAQGGVTPGQLFGAFRTAAIVRGQILGSLKAAEVVPQVVEAIARTALPYETHCTTCNGLGKIHLGEGKQVTKSPCSTCNGLGVILHEADSDQQRVILEMTGLVKSGGKEQTIVQANITAPSASSGGSLEQLQQAVSELIYQRPASTSAVEAVVVESSPREPT